MGKNTWNDPQITEALACAEKMEAARQDEKRQGAAQTQQEEA